MEGRLRLLRNAQAVRTTTRQRAIARALRRALAGGNDRARRAVRERVAAVALVPMGPC